VPFKSQAQRRWMYANEPAMAERWQAHTPKGARLPEKIGGQNRKPKGQGGGGQWAGYVASPLLRDRQPPG